MERRPTAIACPSGSSDYLPTIPLRKLRSAVRSAQSVAVAVTIEGTQPIVVRVSKRAVLNSIRHLKARKVKSVRAEEVLGELVIG